jgi:O-antigen ligase
MIASTSVLWNGNISNAAFFILFIYASLTVKNCFTKTSKANLAPLIFLFLSPLVAVFLGQLLRGELILREFDAPVRVAGAIAIYLLVRHQNLPKDFVRRAIFFGSALGLLTIAFFIDNENTLKFGKRFSTGKSAPNDLGGYTGLLILVVATYVATLFVKQWDCPRRTIRQKILYSVVGLVSLGFGAYVLVGTQSRGPWLCVSIILTAIIIWGVIQRPKAGSIFLLSLITIILIGAQFGSSDLRHGRIGSMFSEPYNWVNEKKQTTSGAIRLSIIPASIDLFTTRPWTGFGDFGYGALAKRPEFSEKHGRGVAKILGQGGGAHNEVLARSLQSGVWGLIAATFLLVYPVYRFGRQLIQSEDENQKFLSLMGLVIFAYIFLLSFVLEPYSLKHTATFNALLLAVLLGSTQPDSHRLPDPPS